MEQYLELPPSWSCMLCASLNRAGIEYSPRALWRTESQASYSQWIGKRTSSLKENCLVATAGIEHPDYGSSSSVEHRCECNTVVVVGRIRRRADRYSKCVIVA